MVIDSGYDRIDTANPATSDSSVIAMIRPYKEQLEVSMYVILAVLEEDLIKEQPEGTLGNHIAAITFDCAQANYSKEMDFSIIEYWENTAEQGGTILEQKDGRVRVK